MSQPGEFIDDGGPQLIVRGAHSDQALWVRVGPVHAPDGSMDRDPGIWIEFQPVYMGSPLIGPILLTKELWGDLAAQVDWLLDEWVENRRASGE